MEHSKQYLNKKNLIIGGINSGKTIRTLEILDLFRKSGYEERTAILDLAPESIKGVGGKMKIPSSGRLFYLTGNIAAPRLSGKNEEETNKIAAGNASITENLFKQLSGSGKDILFINDATLYFHAGDFRRFVETLGMFKTSVINAYYGNYFTDSEITRREKKLTEDLMKICDQVIDCGKMPI
jgi:hypothetical protein